VAQVAVPPSLVVEHLDIIKEIPSTVTVKLTGDKTCNREVCIIEKDGA
jgi:hypothetical protein